MSKMNTTATSSDSFKELTNLLYNIRSDYEYKISDANDKGYHKGFEDGLKKGTELASIDLDTTDPDVDIDLRTIKIFASWCYIHGIDFSYMAKATDRESFEERVIKRFIQDLKNKNKPTMVHFRAGVKINDEGVKKDEINYGK